MASGGLDLKNPGGKEYLIAGATGLAIYLAYSWWKNRNTAAAPAAAPVTAGGASPTGTSTSDLNVWVQDHASSPKGNVSAHPCPPGYHLDPAGKCVANKKRTKKGANG